MHTLQIMYTLQISNGTVRKVANARPYHAQQPSPTAPNGKKRSFGCQLYLWLDMSCSNRPKHALHPSSHSIGAAFTGVRIGLHWGKKKKKKSVAFRHVVIALTQLLFYILV